MDGAKAIAGSAGEGLWYSTNSGQTWTQSDKSTGFFYAVSMVGPNAIAGSAGEGLWYSTNYGQTWAQSDKSTDSFNAVSMVGANAIAGSDTEGLWYSTNSGQTWTQSDKSTGSFKAVSMVGTNAIAGSNDNTGLWYSTNSGQTWTQTNITTGNNNALYMTVDSIIAGMDSKNVVYSLYINPTPTPIISNICFPAGTNIRTDQGNVAIEKIIPGKNTIYGKEIKHITRTVSSDNYLIKIEKDALERNKPNKTTVMSKEHKIEFQGQLVPAHRFLNYSEKVKKIKYNGEILYNVLQEEYGTIQVNNLSCETLEPTSPVACLYMGVSYKEGKVERWRIKTQPNLF